VFVNVNYLNPNPIFAYKAWRLESGAAYRNKLKCLSMSVNSILVQYLLIKLGDSNLSVVLQGACVISLFTVVINYLL
jgi:hypothetical protein